MKSVESDKIDTRIVDLLMEDGRMPAAEIARRLGGGISERIVRYRIGRMESQGILRVWPVVNPRSFGLLARADVVLEVEADRIEQVARRLAEYDCISYVACSIGETDVSIQVVERDAEAIFRFVTEQIGKIPGVRKTATSLVPIVLKDVYQWRMPGSRGPDGNA